MVYQLVVPSFQVPVASCQRGVLARRKFTTGTPFGRAAKVGLDAVNPRITMVSLTISPMISWG